MARSLSPQAANGLRITSDDTLPFNCTIEGSQVVEGRGVYSIRVGRLLNEPSQTWLLTKHFQDFFDFNNVIKEWGYDLELPPKKAFGRTDRTFMAERQKGLQNYLDLLIQRYELCNSLFVQQFLDPDNHQINHSESAAQYVSMFTRSTNNTYQVIESLPDLGWRHNKSYFLATKNGAPKDDRYLISWCAYGLDKAFGEKDISNCLKLLKSIAHPLIVPIDEVSANENGTLIVYRFCSKGSLKDYLHQTKPANGTYWKRYGPKSPSRGCDVSQIKTFGRQILEALNFIYDNGLAYGHLHSGNLLFDLEQAYPVKLLDVANVITGASSKYRCYISNLKDIRTLEQCDVYGFGRVLYELATGEECPTPACIQLPNTVPIPVQHIILRIFAPPADLPTIQQLLNEDFFQMPISSNIERFQLKLSPRAKEAFGQISRMAQERLEGDQIKIKNAQRRLKTGGQSLTEEEKLKRRRERQLRAAAGQNSDPNLNQTTTISVPRSVSIDPLQLTTQSSKRPLTSNMSVDIPNSPSPPASTTTKSPLASPPPPPPISSGPPPPPPPPPPMPSASGGGDRSQLLSSITDFSHAKLKKTKTNDRSGPKFK